MTILSNHPPHDANPRITYLTHGLTHIDTGTMNAFSDMRDPLKMLTTFNAVLPVVAKELYEVPAVWDLYQKRDEFDVFIIDQMFNEVCTNVIELFTEKN